MYCRKQYRRFKQEYCCQILNYDNSMQPARRLSLHSSIVSLRFSNVVNSTLWKMCINNLFKKISDSQLRRITKIVNMEVLFDIFVFVLEPKFHNNPHISKFEASIIYGSLKLLSMFENVRKNKTKKLYLTVTNFD